MPAIKRITNNNPNVEAKVNYFIDRFNHYVLYGGSEWHMELENQLSLIEKIHFQLTKDSEIRPVYFDNYFAHELLDDADDWRSYPAFQAVNKVILAYKAANSDKEKKLLLNQMSFQKSLENLLEELRHYMPETLINLLMRIFTCGRPLEDHEHVQSLNLIAKLIVSEGYFSGKSGSDLSGVINRIFYDKDNDKYGDAQFPYPAEIKKAQRKKYASARLLENQIRGFKSVMQEDPNSGTVIMRVFGSVRLPEDFEFRYNDVWFLGAETAKIKKIKATIPERNADFIDFFQDKDCFYVAANLQWFSFYNIKYRMRDIVREQLEYVSVLLKRVLEVDHTGSFLTATRQWNFVGGSCSFGHGATSFGHDQLEVLKDNNVFKALYPYKSSSAAKHILEIESQLIRALKSGEIADYWKYLEALIPLDHNGGKQIKDVLPRILLLDEKIISDDRIFSTMVHSFDFFNGGYIKLGVNIKHMAGIRKQLRSKKVPKPVRALQYPFVTELLNEHDKSFDSAYFEKARAYYHGIVTEAYAIRNFDVHSGNGNNRALIKIQKSLPGMIFRLRGLLLKEIKEHPGGSINIVIDTLRKKSGDLTKS